MGVFRSVSQGLTAESAAGEKRDCEWFPSAPTLPRCRPAFSDSDHALLFRYRSALVENGINFVLFDQSKTAILETKLVDVLQIAVRYRDTTRYGSR